MAEDKAVSVLDHIREGCGMPLSHEIQFDEKWNFVAKKEKNCDPDAPRDDEKGEDWNHTAVDPESRLLLVVVPGPRTAENCKEVVQQAHDIEVVRAVVFGMLCLQDVWPRRSGASNTVNTAFVEEQRDGPTSERAEASHFLTVFLTEFAEGFAETGFPKLVET